MNAPMQPPADRQSALTVLVTSAGRRAGLIEAFRTAGVDLGVVVRVIACDQKPLWSAACHLADEGIAVPPVGDPGYIDALLAIVAEHDVGLVVPTIDPELLPLSLARQRFAAVGAEVVVSSPTLIDIARDKLRTAEFFAENGVAVPATRSLEECRHAPQAGPWPAIVKPRGGSAGRAISVARSSADLPDTETEPMIVQALLHGEEWTVNLYFDAEGILRSVVPHLRVQVRGGEVEKGVVRRMPALDAIARRLAECLPEPRGVLCFQAMVSPDGDPYVFEINARFGGGYPLADRAGARFAQWLVEERLGLPSSISEAWQEGMTMLRFDAAVFVSS